MTISWFFTVRHALSAIHAATLDDIVKIIRKLDGIRQGLLFTPACTTDPYLDDGPPPAMAIQLDFAAVEPLEAALASDGGLQSLTPLFANAQVEEQAMLARSYPVADPIFHTPTSGQVCTYMVAYEGVADDPHAWLSHYLAHHPTIMARFPGIRQITIFTRLDWCSALGIPRANALQRNKVVFDDEAALTAALASPVRHEMRADFHRFPKYTGQIKHFPMHTHMVA